MARLIPNLPHAALRDSQHPELETLARLRQELSDDYTVFHSVHWSREYDSGAAFGEIDFVVLHRSGDVLFIEQKNGLLEESAAGLIKDYGDGSKDPVRQLHRSMDSIRAKFGYQHGEQGPLAVDYLVYCPDHRLRSATGPGIDPTRIVDASRKADLAGHIRHLLPVARSGRENGRRRPDHDTVFEFFRQSFHLEPDIHAHLRAGERAFIRHTGVLAGILDDLEMDPWRLRVRATAGSGKSVLACRFTERRHQAGKRSLLVCFNRPLAERLRARAPREVMVNTFHGFCHAFLESRGQTVDFSQADRDRGFWPRLLERVTAETIPPEWCFDALAVDEGQDFEPEWFEILKLFLKDDADILWVEDPDQNLMMKAPVPLPGYVGFRSRDNYRSPASIVRYIQENLPFEFRGANELPGMGVGVHHCESAEEQPRVVARLIGELARQGFRYEDMALITCHGLGRSVLARLDEVGPVRLRRFTGEYDEGNQQVLTEGQLLFDSVYRFKGQEAPAVILVDVDPRPEGAEQRLRWERVMYCGLTRGTVRVEVVTLGP